MSIRNRIIAGIIGAGVSAAVHYFVSRALQMHNETQFLKLIQELDFTVPVDFTRLAVAMGEGEDMSYGRNLDPRIVHKGEYNTCEGCGGGEADKDTIIYGTSVYKDRECTEREYQTGGDVDLCYDCLLANYEAVDSPDEWYAI
ncbi:hypothetical protein [Nocardia phage P3.1]|nr:hypothetical protein [Nocardia phage P3.1]